MVDWFEVTFAISSANFICLGSCTCVSNSQINNIYCNGQNCVSDETTVPDFAFLHFDGVDHAGHSYVWGSENQRKAMQDADYHISRVFNLYKKLSVWNETLVMIVSDVSNSATERGLFDMFTISTMKMKLQHGGYAFGHGGDRTTDVLVPWMVAGPGIQKQELLTFVRSEDSSPTILRFLGIQAPNAWTGIIFF